MIVDQPSLSRFRRSKDLIAFFKDGYATGWRMAVPEAFKAALDIRLTARIVNNVSVKAWTQGRMFAFERGDTLYDAKHVSEDWIDGLKRLTIGVQVTRSKPARYENGRFDPGVVVFRVLRKNAANTGLVEAEILECSQEAFVSFLRTGVVKAVEGVTKDLFGPGGD